MGFLIYAVRLLSMNLYYLPFRVRDANRESR